MNLADEVIEKNKIPNVVIEKNKISKISPLFSEYLLTGYKTDNVKIVDYDYTPAQSNHLGKLDLNLRITDCYMSKDIGFFLSSITAEVWVQQASIILIHLHSHLSVKSKEVILLERSTTYNKFINSKDINISTTIINKSPHSKYELYELLVNVNQDSMVGTIKGLL